MITEELIDDLIAERGLDCTPQQFRAKAAIQKLAPLYEDTEHGDLFLAIIGLAIVDVADFKPGTRNPFFAVDAHKYLSQAEIPACSAAGLDTDYVKRVVSSTLRIGLN